MSRVALCAICARPFVVQAGALMCDEKATAALAAVKPRRRLIGWRVRCELMWGLTWEPQKYALDSLPGAREQARQMRAAGGYRNVRIVRVYRVRRGKGEG